MDSPPAHSPGPACWNSTVRNPAIRRILHPCWVLSFVCFLSASLGAQTTYTWTGAGAGANWSAPANWSGGTVPMDDEGLPGGTSNPDSWDLIRFTGSKTTSNLNIAPSFAGSGYNIAELQFTNTLTTGLTLSGELIDMVGSGSVNDAACIKNDSAYTQTITNNMVNRHDSSSALEWRAHTGDILFTGILSGGVAAEEIVIANQTGRTVTFSGDNTYGSQTVVASGILVANHNDALGSSAADANTVVQSGATLAITGGRTIAEVLTLNGTGDSNQGALHNVSGNTTLSGAITLGSSADIQSSAGSLTLSGTVANSGHTLTFESNSGSITASGIISGTGGLTKTGSGTTTLSAANTFSGTTTLSVGTLTLGHVNALQNSTLDVGASGSQNLAFTGTLSTYNIGALAGADAILLGGNSLSVGGNDAGTTYSGTISGTGGLTKTGSGNLILAGANTYTGTSVVAEGSVELAFNNVFSDSSTLQLLGGTLRVDGVSDTLGTYLASTTASYINFQGQSGGLLTFGAVTNTSASTTNYLKINGWTGIHGIAAGTAASTTTGFFVTEASITTAMTRLAGQTTFLGWGPTSGWKNVGSGTYELVPEFTSNPTNTAEGIYRWDGNSPLGTDLWSSLNAHSNWVGNPAAQPNAAGVTVYFGDDAANSAQTVNIDTNKTVGTLVFDNHGSRTYDLTSSSTTTRTLTLNGSGIGTPGVPNAFITVVGNQAATIGTDSTKRIDLTLGDHTRILNLSTATTGLTLGSPTGTASTLALASYQLEVTGTGSTVINSTVTSTAATGALLKDGGGTLTLGGTSANTYTGTTTINDGTVILAKTAGLNATGTGAITIGDGVGAANSATLQLQTGNQIANTQDLTIRQDGRFNGGTAAETIDDVVGSGTLQNSSGGSITLDKLGATLSGSDPAGAFTGVLDIDGTLTLNGGIIADSASAAGSGTINLTTGNTLELQGSVTFGGTLTLADNTTLKLTGASVDLGTLEVSGHSVIDFGGASIVNLDSLKFLSPAASLTIINWTQNSDALFAASFGNNLTAGTYDTAGMGLAPQNQITFTGWSANETGWASYDRQIYPNVPEPSAYGALLLSYCGALLLISRRRDPVLRSAAP